jgi:hypothetical protein
MVTAGAADWPQFEERKRRCGEAREERLAAG